MIPAVYLLVLDRFADWEASLAASEIVKSGRYSVVTVGLTPEPVRSMGALLVQPDTVVDAIALERAALLLVPGGTSWEAAEDPRVTTLLQNAAAAGVPIAALCGATIGLARAGLLAGRKHTSNMRGYLARLVPGYGSEADYREQPAVRDGTLITASGMGGVELAYEVIKLLGLYDEADGERWLRTFRDKFIPADGG